MSLYPDWVQYSPIVDRPPIRWPNNARVAFWVAPNVEYYEYLPPVSEGQNPWPRTPHPDVQQFSYRDYGNRIGFWRMLEVCDKYNVKCGVSLNVAVLEHHPEIAEAMIQRDWDYMTHGIYNTRHLTHYTEEQEREFYRDNIETLRRLTGKTLKGMLSPARFGSPRTPELMADAGLIYFADLVHDDQPVPIKVKSGKLISVPYTMELNDSRLFYHHSEGDYFLQVCKDQFDQLYEEGAESGRVMCISLHPFMIGQPHKIKYLDAIFDYVLSHDYVWQATGDEIADHYIANYYDQAVAYAERFNQ